MQAEADRRGERVHQAADRRAFLRHRHEQLTGHLIFEQAHRQVAFVVGDVELVRNRTSRGRQAATVRAEHGRFQSRHVDVGLLLVGILGNVERLNALGAVAIDGHRLEAQIPAVAIDPGDLVDGDVVGDVDGLGDRTRQERLDGRHHADVSHVVDAADALGGAEGTVEHGQVVVVQVRGVFDRIVLVDVVDDLGDLVGLVAQTLQRERHGLVDQLEIAPARELLVLDQGGLRLDAGRVAIHHEADGARRGED